MALRSGIVTRHQIPHEPGEWVEVRALGWRDLDQARRARTDDSFASLRKMGKELYQMISESRTDGPSELDPLLSYDLATVLELGVAAWSYNAPVSPETLGQLDEQTAQWVARLIVGADDEAESDRKNG